MRVTTRVRGSHRRVGGLVVGALVLSSAGLTALATQTTVVAVHTAAAHAAGTPTWVTTQGKTVHLTLIAAWNNTNSGFNFDGAAHGQMVVTVPLGDKVVATFKNNAQGAQHDVVLIPYQMPLPGSARQPAFSGAASPVPQFRPGGSPPGAGAAEAFSFTASKAGKYMLVCGIAGHALAGMWDIFIVSPTAKAASVTFNKAGVATTTGTTRAPAKTPTWATTTGKTVHLTLIAAWNNTNAGFNFDGGAHGQMVVTVPLGDKVVGTFKNDASTPHDVRIVNYQTPPPPQTVALAFAGASAGGPPVGAGGSGGPRPGGTPGPGGAPSPGGTPGPGAGGPPQSSSAPQTFSFVANKAGTYMIICGFPGHALAGMWDTFVVSKTAKAASITFK